MTSLLLLLSAVAVAAPVGQPVPLPDGGRVEAVVQGDIEAVEVVDDRCPHDGNCDAVWRKNGTALEARLTVLRGFGVFGEVGWGSQRVREADYRGVGLSGAVGVRGAVPVFDRGWWLAATARYDWGGGQGTTLDLGGRESASWQVGTVSLLAAWRDDGGGVSTWLGGQGSWLWRLDVLPLGEEDGEPRLELGLTPMRPVSWVAGSALTSEPLGGGWRRSARMSVGFEGRLGQSMGATAFLGVSY